MLVFFKFRPNWRQSSVSLVILMPHLKVFRVERLRWIQILHDVGEQAARGIAGVRFAASQVGGNRTGGTAGRAGTGALQKARTIDTGGPLSLLVPARSGAV